jgi:hypothetical protein
MVNTSNSSLQSTPLNHLTPLGSPAFRKSLVSSYTTVEQLTTPSLSAAQTEGTLATTKAAIHLLNYAASHLDATICYHASDMCLHVHSDASYLSESKARSCAGGIFFLSSLPTTAKNAPTPKLNGVIHIGSSIMRNVLASATEAKVSACFHNAQDACPLRVTLEEMNWPQPPTPIQVNLVAHYCDSVTDYWFRYWKTVFWQ